MAYTHATDTDPKKLTKSEEKEILETVNRYWEEALDDIPWKEARQDMVKCFDYKENRQWTKEELKELEERGQPATVNNQVAVTIDRIVGQFVQVKSKTVYKPRNSPQDVDVAQGMSDIYSYIRQTSGLEFEERDVIEDGATGGFGVFEVCIEDNDDPTGKDVKVKHEDCFNVIPDPRSKRYDWNEDARYICRYKWVDRDYLKELYPKKKKAIDGLFEGTGTTQLSDVDALTGEAFIDYKRDRVRLVEVQYKEFADVTKYVFSDGKVMTEDEAKGKLDFARAAGVTWETKEDREEYICITVFSDDILFESGRSKRKRYSFVPYFVKRKKSGGPYSQIFTSLPIQDAINKRESKAISLLTLNQTVFEEGAIQDDIEWKSQNARPDGMLKVQEGFFERVRIDKNLELAQSQNQMHQQSKQDFRLVTGVNPDALGEKSEVRSGVGIQRKVAMTGLVVAPVFDNFKRTREALGKTIHDAVCVAYTGEKVMTITDNPKLVRSVILDNKSVEAIKQTKYDVIISEDQDFDTVQEQQQEMLMKNLPQILQFGPAWGEVFFEMSSLRDKDAILQKVKEIQKQNAPKKDHSLSFSLALDKATPVEKAFFYQEMGMPPQMLQQMMQSNPPPSQVIDAQAKQASEQAKLQSEQVRQAGQAQTEQHKHALEQQKQQTVAVKSQAEQQKAQADLQSTAQKAQVDQQKGQIDIAKAQVDLIKSTTPNPGGNSDGR